ncbi:MULTISPECIES: cytochrome c oxidase subunit 2A [unclassified Bacillus (in: firmicutes)]|nr:MULTISPECIES: cytochrome c oxidase subunit 2A [unclassified Bacillus (in: firmicutes)]SFA99247.1 Cytochrome c oxidase subunit IIa family protein [Bacillus sp. UNCCL13]SFQ81532.1 Cytochrome c oxidase subunit IIa family protein [Bacillus sp. cl95]
MANTVRKASHKKHSEENTSLKGTLASVFFLGLFLIVTWVSVYFLFLDRF